MSDIAYTKFQHYGTAAERLAFTPDPPATGQPVYIWYESDTDNVYAYTTAWHQLSSGLAGSSIFFDANDGFSFSQNTGAFSTKGNEFLALESFTVTSTWARFLAVNGATYKVTIAEVNSSHVIQAITGTSASHTINNTNTEYREFAFASPVAIVAGTRYAIVFTRTDSTTNSAMSMSIYSSAGARYVVAPVDTFVGFLTLASVDPQVGNTFTTATGICMISIKGAYA